MTFTIEPMINAGKARHPRARRRLDHRHQGPQPVGAVGAHRARHRDRLRGADAVGRQPRRRRRVVDAPMMRGRSLPRPSPARAGAPPTAAAQRRRARCEQARAAACSLRRPLRELVDRIVPRSSGATPACPPARRWSPSAATAAASCSRTPTSTCWSCCRTSRRRPARSSASRRLIGTLLGHRPGDRLQRAHASKSCVEAAADDVTVQHLAARSALPRRQPRSCSASFERRCAQRCDPRRSSTRRRSRGAAPRQVRGHALLARAQPARKPRAACATCRYPLDRARRGPRPHAGASSSRRA